jgi:hypothetical protein
MRIRSNYSAFINHIPGLLICARPSIGPPFPPHLLSGRKEGSYLLTLFAAGSCIAGLTDSVSTDFDIYIEEVCRSILTIDYWLVTVDASFRSWLSMVAPPLYRRLLAPEALMMIFPFTVSSDSLAPDRSASRFTQLKE